MLPAFALLLLCQLVGEVAVRAAGLRVPGPLIGLALLVALLALAARWGKVDPETVETTAVGRTATGLIGILGLLFVPAGAGVVQHLALLETHGLALALALVASTLLTLVVTVFAFTGVSRFLARRRDG